MIKSAIIRSCATLNEAYIISGLLSSRGIPSSLDNANHAAVNWFVIPALGGVHIRVPCSFYEVAKREIIDQVNYAELVLFDDKNNYEEPITSQRWKGISMLLIWLGLPLLPVYVLVAWLNQFNPAS